MAPGDGKGQKKPGGCLLSRPSGGSTSKRGTFTLRVRLRFGAGGRASFGGETSVFGMGTGMAPGLGVK